MFPLQIYPSDYGLEQMQKEESLGPVELKDDEGGSENLGENGNTEVRCKDFWSIKISGIVCTRVWESWQRWPPEFMCTTVQRSAE